MKTIGKKLLSMIITLLVVSFLVFFAFDMIPGDAAISKLGTEATPERIEALRTEMGLNAPFFTRYGRFLRDFVSGDMGTSYSYNMPVGEMILDKLPITLTLTVLAFIMVIVISIPLGIYTAMHEGKKADKCIYVINQVIMAVPSFFAGILLTLIFGLVLHLFTPGGYVSYEQNPGKFIAYLIFPAIAIALPKAAMAVKLLRSSLLEERKKDYVRTAYSRGNRTKGVFYSHMLKNAMIPVITFLGMTFTDMFVGSIIVEQVFSIPGLGRILLTSISNRDYPVVEAIIICLTCVIVLVNFVVDVIYRVVDPRIDN